MKGTGLGLPLCRKLAALLGGEVGVKSEPGLGSTFFARIPLRYHAVAAEVPEQAPAVALPESGTLVLVVEDDEATRMLYERYLRGSGYRAVSVATLAAAREMMKAGRPAAVILDILLPGEEQQSWRWLAEIKAADSTLPVIVASVTRDDRKALSLGADVFMQKPVSRDKLIATLRELVPPRADRVALIIDDDEAARYVIRHSVKRPMKFEEAADGASGLELASRVQPGVIFLDLAMPGMHGGEVLEQLKADPATAQIPVIVITSQDVDSPMRARLAGHARAILQKRDLSAELIARTLDSLELHEPLQ